MMTSAPKKRRGFHCRQVFHQLYSLIPLQHIYSCCKEAQTTPDSLLLLTVSYTVKRSPPFFCAANRFPPFVWQVVHFSMFTSLHYMFIYFVLQVIHFSMFTSLHHPLCLAGCPFLHVHFPPL